MNRFERLGAWLGWGAALVMLLILIATRVSAHGGDNSLIHSCVKSNTGSLRIVDPNDPCANNEHSLDWNGAGSTHFVGIFLDVPDFLVRLHRQDLINANLDLANLYYPTIMNTDATGISFVNAAIMLGDFQGSTLTNANFSYAQVRETNFVITESSGASFANAFLGGTRFENANLSNANFDNARIEMTTLLGANMTGANLNNATWVNTICPDGTNSDNNGGTCIGHLTP